MIGQRSDTTRHETSPIWEGEGWGEASSSRSHRKFEKYARRMEDGGRGKRGLKLFFIVEIRLSIMHPLLATNLRPLHLPSPPLTSLYLYTCIACGLQNDRYPLGPNSVPIPLSLTPPKAACTAGFSNELTNTLPAWSWRATRCACSTSLPHTTAPRPVLVSLARLITSVSEL